MSAYFLAKHLPKNLGAGFLHKIIVASNSLRVKPHCGWWLLLPLYLSLVTLSAAVQLVEFSLSDQLTTVQRARLQALWKVGSIEDVVLNRAALAEQNTRLQVERLQLEVANAQQALNAGQGLLEEQRKALANAHQQVVEEARQAQQQQQIARLEQQIQEQQTKLQAAQQQLEAVQERLTKAQQESESAIVWHEQVEELSQYFNQQGQELQALAAQEKQEQRIDRLRQELAQLSDSVADLAKRSWLEAEILVTKENAQLLLQDARLDKLQGELTRLQKLEASALEVADLQVQTKASQEVYQQLLAVQALLQGKMEGVKRQIALLDAQLADAKQEAGTRNYLLKAQKLISQLAEALSQQDDRLQQFLAPAKVLDERLQKRLAEATRQNLLQPRQLPKDLVAWGKLWEEILSVPQTMRRYLLLAAQQAQLRVVQAYDNGQWWIAGLLLAWLLLLLWGRQRIRRKLQALAQQAVDFRTFSGNSLRLALFLTLRYLPELGLIGLLALFILLLPLQHLVFLLLLVLGGFWLGLRLSQDLAWRLLAAEDAPQNFRDPTLYRQLKPLLWLTWGFTSLALLMHNLPFSRPLTELYDSLYILFLSLLIVPHLRLRHQLIQALAGKLSAYWLFTLRLSSLLFVLGIVLMSCLALFGYINLAWAMARFLGGFLLLFTLWLVARGYLLDAIIFSKNYALKHSPNYGLLWTQDIIPLLHKLLQIALVLSLVWLLLRINGLHVASESVQAGIAYPLLTVGSSIINIGGLISALFAVWFVIWFGNWIRQITYRWIYTSVLDLGARHSLSAFTQYSVVLVGLVIALNIMGVDLTTLTVFAGAVGVGLGFGLKNVADNFISGVLLLIERPLKTGDVVNIDGTYEGKVKQIGIRSLTINTWDNQDVIVPNSQLISTPFINWSHDDWILRTVLYIGVGYQSDLRKVKSLIEDILEQHPIVEKTQDRDVFLYEFGDSSVTFRVQYFIDADKNGLLSIKSDILFRIWETFKAHDIEIPYPQRDLHIKTESTTESTDAPSLNLDALPREPQE